MLPQSLSNGACSLVPGEVRPTLTVELTIGPRGVRGASMFRSLIRSDARLDYDRVDRIFAGSESCRGALGRAAGGRAGRGGRARTGCAAAARRSCWNPPSQTSASTAAGDVVAGEPATQTESHRLIEHLMIAANEQVAQFLEERKIPTLYRVHERPESAAVDRLIEQLDVARGADPAGARRPSVGRPGGRARRRGVAVGRRLGGADRTRRTSAELTGAALAQAGVLQRSQPRSRRAGVAALLPLHLPDPPLPGPDLPPRGAVGGGRRAGARRRLGARGGAVDVGPRAPRDDDRARRRRRRSLFPAGRVARWRWRWSRWWGRRRVRRHGRSDRGCGV